MDQNLKPANRRAFEDIEFPDLDDREGFQFRSKEQAAYCTMVE